MSVPSGTSPASAPTALTASVSQLVMKVSGQERTVTVTNTGTDTAENLRVNLTGLPSGTALGAQTCGTTLAGGASCSFTFKPGATPTAAPGDLAPATALLEIASDNANTVSVNVSVIDYGSVYQGGYVFAIDDGTDPAGSIGGKVAAPRDIPGADSWGDPTPVDGTNDNSTAPCLAAVEGACNTGLLTATLQSAATAANACATSRAAGFSDWYLPAICEMGFNRNNGPADFCGTETSPLLADNMQSRLMGSGDPASLSSKDYFSSTSWSGSAPGFYAAFAYAFATSTSYASLLNKEISGAGAVRCVRALTQP